MNIVTVCNWLSVLLGECAEISIVMFLLTVFDYISAVIYAFVSSSLTAKKHLRVMLQKLMVLSILFLIVFIEALLGVSGRLISLILISFYIYFNAISIFTTFDRFGIPLPSLVKDVLTQMLMSTEGGESGMAKYFTINLLCDETTDSNNIGTDITDDA